MFLDSISQLRFCLVVEQFEKNLILSLAFGRANLIEGKVAIDLSK